MPKDLSDNIKSFLLFLRGDDKSGVKPIASSVTIKKKNRKTKFKLRCPRYLYTLKIDDETKAKKITSSIPSSVKKIEIATENEINYGSGYTEEEVKQITKGYTNNGLFYERKNGKHIIIVEEIK